MLTIAEFMDNKLQKKAAIVLIAGVLVNLTVGVLYAWSVLKVRMTAPVTENGWGLTSSQAGLPYTFAIVFLALGLLIGGRIQDKIGPRWVVTSGGVLAGFGIILAGLIGNSAIGLTVSFGIIAGLGIGFAYGCVTPPALKWFHPSKKGLVSGLIVGGFGLSAVYYAPLANTLLNNFGLERTLLFLGAGVLIVTVTIAQFIKNPPPGYVPAAPEKIKQSITASVSAINYTWREMIKTKRFYLMVIIFLLTSSVGLMVIGNMTKIASTQAGITYTMILAMLVSFLAFVNSVGRVIGGFMSDKIGRINALFVVFVLQMLNMIGFVFYQSLPALIIGIIGIGFCFGTLLAVFPALTADQFGLKNYGANYGIVFLAWGLSGVVAPVIANYFFDIHGNFTVTYIICAIMMVVMIFINFLLKKEIVEAAKVKL